MSDLGSHPQVEAVLAGDDGLHTVEHHAEVTSTNDVVLQRIRAGEAPGLVVVGDRQTRGRGRAGRSWQDGPSADSSLMFTMAAPSPGAAIELVPLAVGLALADAVVPLGVQAGLKWPNDALVGDRKWAGTLVERHDLDGDAVLLIGVGVDVDWRRVERTGEAEAWTSLAEVTGESVDRGELLAGLLASLTERLRMLTDDPDRLLADYRGACTTLGEEVAATLPGGDRVTGHARDVDDRGRLLIDTDHVLVAVTAGDVEHLRPSPARPDGRDDPTAT